MNFAPYLDRKNQITGNASPQSVGSIGSSERHDTVIDIAFRQSGTAGILRIIHERVRAGIIVNINRVRHDAVGWCPAMQLERWRLEQERAGVTGDQRHLDLVCDRWRYRRNRVRHARHDWPMMVPANDPLHLPVSGDD